MPFFLLYTENHGLCPWFQKGYAYEQSRRSGLMPSPWGEGAELARRMRCSKKFLTPHQSAGGCQLPPKGEAFKKPTANTCWQRGMYAKENSFVGLKAKLALSPYRACAGHPLYGWSWLICFKHIDKACCTVLYINCIICISTVKTEGGI